MLNLFFLQVADILQKDPDTRPDVEELLNERIPKVLSVALTKQLKIATCLFNDQMFLNVSF